MCTAAYVNVKAKINSLRETGAYRLIMRQQKKNKWWKRQYFFI